MSGDEQQREAAWKEFQEKWQASGYLALEQDCFDGGYTAASRHYEQRVEMLECVLKMANIVVAPDGSHKFSPKAVRHYCGQNTAQRIGALETALRHYAEPRRWQCEKCRDYRHEGMKMAGVDVPCEYGYWLLRGNGYDIAAAALAPEKDQEGK